MIGFGSLLIFLISLVVVLITQNNDKKITVYKL
nr:putative holin-like toxin [Carnobacterium sp. CP1]